MTSAASLQICACLSYGHQHVWLAAYVAMHLRLFANGPSANPLPTQSPTPKYKSSLSMGSTCQNDNSSFFQQLKNLPKNCWGLFESFFIHSLCW